MKLKLKYKILLLFVTASLCVLIINEPYLD